MKTAVIVPMELAKDVARMMELFRQVIQNGNKNTAPDGIAGVLMSRSAALASLHNVRVNLDVIRDSDFVKDMTEQAELLRDRVVHLEKEICGRHHVSAT